jgi:hypothetical protein
MIMTELTTLAAGVLSAVGLGAVLLSAATEDAQHLRKLLRLGTYGLNLGGLVLMIGAIAGWQGDDAMFCGLLMVVLGTGMQVYPEAHAGAPAAQGRARQADA